jgi:hypothetical protein
MNLNVLQALGRSDLFLRLEIIKKALIVTNIAVTWKYGISAMIYGMIIISVIAYYLNSYHNGSLISYSTGEQVLDLLPYLVVAALMGLAVYAAGLMQFLSNGSLLMVQILTGIMIYVGLCRLFRLRAFMEIWQATWSKMPIVKAGVIR